MFTLPTTSDQTYAKENDMPQIICHEDFACPDELIPRIEFWASIYYKHDENSAVFHDAKRPSRIYSVIQSLEPCKKIESDSTQNQMVEDERDRIKRLIKQVAQKKSKGDIQFDAQESTVLDLFDSVTDQEMLDAVLDVRCQTGVSNHFQKGLELFLSVEKNIETILKDHGLSLEIKYLPFVESSYNPKALSRAGAAGLWQVMPKTAPHLGLKVNASIDERFDIVRSTMAAAKYFRNAYDKLEQYFVSNQPIQNNHLGPFVITSYNYGISGASKMIKQVGTNFMDVLQSYQSKRFRVAVQNFYASFIAARHVAINHKYFFGEIKKKPFDQNIKFKIDSPISAKQLSHHLNTPMDELMDLNPSLTKKVWDNRVYIPEGFELKLPQHFKNKKDLLAKISSLKIESLDFKEELYKVKKGDNVCSIAKQYSVPCQNVIDENKLTARGLIRIGQWLSIPSKISDQQAFKMAKLEKLGPSLPIEIELKEQKAPKDITLDELFHSFGIGENYNVHEKYDLDKKKFNHFILVQDQESLIHYTQWLGLDSVEPILANNQIHHNNLKLDQQIFLPILDKNQENVFLRQRLEYHKTIEDEFKARFSLQSKSSYKIKANESLEDIAKRFDLPIWLLRRLNPGLDLNLANQDIVIVSLIENQNHQIQVD